MSNIESEVTIDIRSVSYIGNLRIESTPQVSPDLEVLPNIQPGETAWHEATHIAAAKEPAIMATIIPSGNALGLTQLSGPDPEAAVAPHRRGFRGTSFDLLIARRLRGNDLGPTFRGADSRLSGKDDYTHALAIGLEDKKILYREDIIKILNDPDPLKKRRQKAKLKTVSLLIKNHKLHEKRELKTEVNNNVISLPKEWVRQKDENRSAQNNFYDNIKIVA